MSEWLSSLFGFLAPQEPGSGVLPPQDSLAIYDHIMHYIDPITGKLLNEGQTLPDENRRFPGSQGHWISGAIDGVRGHHFALEEPDEVAKQALQDLLEISSTNSKAAQADLYQILVQDQLLSNYQALVIESVVQHPTEYLHDFAVTLATSAPDREPVKFAILLLGGLRDTSDLELVLNFGLHDEFTLFSVDALGKMLDEPEQEIWKLAKKVDGWGKIHAVERLANTVSPEIKNWMLRGGYQNYIMDDYLTYICATTGGLKDALETAVVDDDLFQSLSEILLTLLRTGPAKNIQQYRDAGEVIPRYLKLLNDREGDLSFYINANRILYYLVNQLDEDTLSFTGWDSIKRDKAIALAEQILKKPCWPDLVMQGLKSREDEIFYNAAKAAELMQIDIWDLQWAFLQENPLESRRWYGVILHPNHEQVNQIIELVGRILPLEQIASGPGLQLFTMGTSPTDEMDIILGITVSMLEEYPGQGWSLVACSLKHPVVAMRNTAVSTLSAWGIDRLPEGTLEALKEATQIEPFEETREQMLELLRKM